MESGQNLASEIRADVVQSDRHQGIPDKDRFADVELVCRQNGALGISRSGCS